MADNPIALHVNFVDNVATLFAQTTHPGMEIRVFSPDGSSTEAVLTSIVPYGHKIATREIKKGEHIIKYGEIIGIATSDIFTGDYVHIHNIDALRGRGDL